MGFCEGTLPILGNGHEENPPGKQRSVRGRFGEHRHGSRTDRDFHRPGFYPGRNKGARWEPVGKGRERSDPPQAGPDGFPASGTATTEWPKTDRWHASDRAPECSPQRGEVVGGRVERRNRTQNRLTMLFTHRVP
jgi:hypothetical protein